MATTERSETVWGRCPCGKGEVVRWDEMPDHPWAHRPSDGGVDITCVECAARYVHLPAHEVEGAPLLGPDWDLLCLVERADIKLREDARRGERHAASEVSRLKADLLRRAVALIEQQMPRARYATAAQVFAFSDAEEVKRFAARRHVRTWVEGAAKLRLAQVASYFGTLETLETAQRRMEEASRATRDLGRAHVRHVLKQPSFSALTRGNQ